MADILISQGPGNQYPDSVKKPFKAASAVTEGQVVTLDVGATNPDGNTDPAWMAITIEPADSDGTNLDIVVGVAAENIAAGEWGYVYVQGYCPKVLTDGGVAIGDPLVPHTVAGEADTMDTAEESLVFAWALETDHETVEECACMIIPRC